MRRCTQVNLRSVRSCQLASISFIRFSNGVMDCPQRGCEILGSDARCDAPTSRNRGCSRDLLSQGLLASNSSIEHIDADRGIFGQVAELRLHELQKVSQHDVGSSIVRCPSTWCSDSGADCCLRDVFDQPSEATLQTDLREFDVYLMEVQGLDVVHEHGCERSDQPRLIPEDQGLTHRIGDRA
jgi:hypothetical protein